MRSIDLVQCAGDGNLLESGRPRQIREPCGDSCHLQVTTLVPTEMVTLSAFRKPAQFAVALPPMARRRTDVGR